MSLSKTLFAFIASAIIGAFTVFLAGPKKGLKEKINALKFRTNQRDGENMFV